MLTRNRKSRGRKDEVAKEGGGEAEGGGRRREVGWGRGGGSRSTV